MVGLERIGLNTISAALVYVALHLEVAVLGAEVDVGGEHHLDVLLPLGQRPRAAACRCRRHRRRRSLGFLTAAPCARELEQGGGGARGRKVAGALRFYMGWLVTDEKPRS